MLFFMFSGIFSISAISCSLVIKWAYQHYILAEEVKNSVKERCSASVQMLFFPYDVVLSENDVLEAGWRNCCVCVGNFEFRLSV